nr:hypothetical protein BaRGS_007988 [Batillaria attramentaria]
MVLRVRVSVYLHGLEKQYVEFNGRGSNYLNWFSRDRIISSSWHDLRTEPQNYFSIKGDDETRWNIGRRFFINRNYGGCPHDRGWLIVLDEPDVCSWAGVRDYPVILYSKRSTNVYWNSGSNDKGMKKKKRNNNNNNNSNNANE